VELHALHERLDCTAPEDDVVAREPGVEVPGDSEECGVTSFVVVEVDVREQVLGRAEGVKEFRTVELVVVVVDARHGVGVREVLERLLDPSPFCSEFAHAARVSLCPFPSGATHSSAKHWYQALGEPQAPELVEDFAFQVLGVQGEAAPLRVAPVVEVGLAGLRLRRTFADQGRATAGTRDTPCQNEREGALGTSPAPLLSEDGLAPFEEIGRHERRLRPRVGPPVHDENALVGPVAKYPYLSTIKTSQKMI